MLVIIKAWHVRAPHEESDCWVQMPIPTVSLISTGESSRTSLCFYFLTFKMGMIIATTVGSFRTPINTDPLALRTEK